MAKKRAKARPRARPTPPPERRRQYTLREILDEMVAHVRHVAQHATGMSQEELDYAHERLEWYAEEVWRAALERPTE